MTEDDQNRLDDTKPTERGTSDRDLGSTSKQKAPISFGASVAEQAWNVVPASRDAPQTQPLRRPSPLSPPRNAPGPPSENESQNQRPCPEKPTSEAAESPPSPAPTQPPAKSERKNVTASKIATPHDSSSEQATPAQNKRPRRPIEDEVKSVSSVSPAPPEVGGKARAESAPSTDAGSQDQQGAHSPAEGRLPPKQKLKFPQVRQSTPPPALVEDDAPSDQPWWSRIQSVASHQTPAWMVSLILHFVVVILLALFSVAVYVHEPHEVTATYAEHLGEQLEDNILMLDTEEFEIDSDSGSLERMEIAEQVPVPRSLTELDLIGAEAARLGQEATPGVDLAARGEGATKRALLKAYGGNATTEQAVAEALNWLKRNQLKDGSWSLKGDYTNGAGAENKVAATAMALLAFQGAGHTDRTGDHAKVVARGWKYLLNQLDGDGNFIQDPIPNQHRTYSQAQATIALCELYAMTGDPELKEKAQTAVDYAVAWQAPEGGWRYVPKSESDMSVTGWYLMALQSARMGGLDVPQETLENVSRFLESVASAPIADQDFLPGSRYQYRDSRAEKFTPAMTAEALLCRQYLGWKQDDPRLEAGMNYLLANPIDWSQPDVYYWYYATQVAHHQEGSSWRDWNEKLRQVIPEQQVKSGREKGSWSPAHDDNGVKAGRLFMTCFCTYMLEVYYRHLPIYSKHQLSGL